MAPILRLLGCVAVASGFAPAVRRLPGLHLSAVDDAVDAPAARGAGPERALIGLVDEVLDERPPQSIATEVLYVDAPAGVVCARGVCVLKDDAPEWFDSAAFVCDDDACEPAAASGAAPASQLSLEFLWPRLLLLGCSVLYGTNFPLGRVMNDALPASATSSARFLLAATVLSPFLLRLKPALARPAVACGAFTSLGYISQSIALVDTPGATVAFLGALTVVVVPALGALIDGRRVGGQTVLAGALALAGVAILELGGEGLAVGPGDAWAVLQAVGFGTSFFLTERMMAREPGMALPITAAQCATVAALSGAWAALDGYGLLPGGGGGGAQSAAWLADEATRARMTLPGLFLEPSLQSVAAAAAWTGLVTTAANRIGETVALGKMSSSEASVLLATEPIWAAVFGAALIGEALTRDDAVGGTLIIVACLVNAAEPAQLRALLPGGAADAAAATPSEPERS